MSNCIKLTVNIKIKVPLEIEEIRIENPEAFKHLLLEYQKRQIPIIIENSFDAKQFWIGFIKYTEGVFNHLTKN